MLVFAHRAASLRPGLRTQSSLIYTAELHGPPTGGSIDGGRVEGVVEKSRVTKRNLHVINA
jgi:hypothetical protein